MARLKFDINSMVAFEEAIGESFLGVVNNEKKMTSLKTLRALYWAGTDTSKTLEEAGEKLAEELKKGSTFTKIIGEITEALSDAFLISDGDSKNPQLAKTISE